MGLGVGVLLAAQVDDPKRNVPTEGDVGEPQVRTPADADPDEQTPVRVDAAAFVDLTGQLVAVASDLYRDWVLRGEPLGSRPSLYVGCRAEVALRTLG